MTALCWDRCFSMDINGSDLVYVFVDKSMRKGRDSIRCVYKNVLQVWNVWGLLFLINLKTILIVSV